MDQNVLKLISEKTKRTGMYEFQITCGLQIEKVRQALVSVGLEITSNTSGVLTVKYAAEKVKPLNFELKKLGLKVIPFWNMSIQADDVIVDFELNRISFLDQELEDYYVQMQNILGLKVFEVEPNSSNDNTSTLDIGIVDSRTMSSIRLKCGTRRGVFEGILTDLYLAELRDSIKQDIIKAFPKVKAYDSTDKYGVDINTSAKEEPKEVEVEVEPKEVPKEEPKEVEVEPKEVEVEPKEEPKAEVQATERMSHRQAIPIIDMDPHKDVHILLEVCRQQMKLNQTLLAALEEKYGK